MVVRMLGDAVVVVHLGFILFVVGGPLLAWRWPRLVWLHVPALAWALGTVVIGFPCPLTDLEKELRRLAGEAGYDGGFIDRYLADVIYPGRYTDALRTLAALLIAGGYAGQWRRWRRGREVSPPGWTTTSGPAGSSRGLR